MDYNMCYKGNDMGAVYSKDATSFRVFAPTADLVEVCFYETGESEQFYEIKELQKDQAGTWYLKVCSDLANVYYCYRVTIGSEVRIAGDPYAKACGVNGVKSMVVDLEATNPEGFKEDHGPKVDQVTDIIVCEVSIADTTSDCSSHVQQKGKYLGMAELGTKNEQGYATGLSHFKELGVTHLQIMPCYDFGSIDEADLQKKQYNWGYDPVNYNVPEGSYSTDPFHGEVRIREFKQMIQGIHKAGLGVIMDVVYNHTYDALSSHFEKIAPGYYHRMDGDKFSDASACGNEVASDHAMVRKYIIDSVLYWVKEYHIDGFRFDLMGVLDIDTMNELSRTLREIRPDIILYGEGWTGGDSTLSEEKRSLKVNVSKLEHIGMFSDDIRDGVRGHVFYEEDRGFINGGQHKENDIKFSVVGAVSHPEVDYEAYTYTKTGAYAKSPCDVVNYVSCHDNLTLWDKLSLSCPKATEEEKLAMNRLAATIVFTSQGIPFFLGGEEFARTKPIIGTDQVAENSYNLPIETNSLKYDQIDKYKELYQYYQGLIAIRKKFEEFRMSEASAVVENLHFLTPSDSNVVVFTITGCDRKILVAYNANQEPVSISLPEGQWEVYLQDNMAGVTPIETISHQATISGIAALMAVCED